MKNIILITLIITLFSCEKSKKTEISNTKPKLEILLIGTFHFRNFDPKLNLDVSQTNEIDVLTTENQKELETSEFTAKAGGGAVEITVTGKKEIKKVKLSQEVVDPDDVEMLQDLILTCVNEALRKVDSAQAASMGKYNIPGMM